MGIFQRYIFGYHGCDAEVAREIASGRLELRESQNDYDWLGDGIYFWENSPQRALLWAQQAARNPKSSVKAPGIIGAIIDTKACLDLTHAEHLEMVKEAYVQLARALELAGEVLPKNSGTDLGSRKLDCAVLNALHQFRKKNNLKPFTSVRAFFTEGRELYPNAGIRELDHIQVCVSDPSCIAGFFLPRPEDS